MFLTPFAKLPQKMQNDSVKKYYNILQKRKITIILKRITDILLSLVLLIILSPVMLSVAAAIHFIDGGAVIFKQQRITRDCKTFYIYKFRTMNVIAGNNIKITAKNDIRITKTGKYLRKTRLDELPQLFNVIKGDMSFVGARPEVPEYVASYNGEMLATLLMPAGITSMASIKFKDEAELLEKAQNCEQTYIDKILPEKMKCNLNYLTKISIKEDFMVMLKTIFKIR